MSQALLHRWLDSVRTRDLPPDYRPDIDGLRAIAILPVVLFHAFPTSLRGGFVGVDIFFVISGFLISSIVFKGVQQGRFSFSSFYMHRARRIFPALVLVLAATFGYGWFALLPDEFARLGLHMAAGAGFVQNLVLWREAGYFDAASELKPLLHLWSLAIEEQFYLLYPLLIWLASRARVNLLLLLALLGAASFGMNVRGVVADPVGGFFLPHMRFWELLAGGVVAWIHVRGQSSAVADERWWRALSPHGLSWLGLLLISVSVFGLHRGLHFPGGQAVLPVAGAVALILAGPHGWVNRVVLSNRWLVFIGLISYPLYLWHWPLLSFAHLVEGRSPGPEVRGALMALALVLAWLTYVLVERPIRFGGHRRVWAWALAGALLVVGGVGAFTYGQAGVPSRAVAKRVEAYTGSVVRTSREKECFEIPYAYKRAEGWNCLLGDSGRPPGIMVYGDSHALSMIPVLDQYGKDVQVGIAFAGTSGCPPLLGIQSLRGEANMALHNCQKLNDRVFDFVREQGIRRVLLISRWTYYTGGETRPDQRNPISMDVRRDDSLAFARESFIFGLRKTVEAYRRIGVKVYLMSDVPQQEVGPIAALKLSGLDVNRVNEHAVSRQQHDKDQAWVRQRLAEMKALGATVLDFDDIVCEPGGVCPLAAGGRSLYFDSDHLSVQGAMALYEGVRSGLAQ